MGDLPVCYRFGPFVLDPVRRMLLCDGAPVPLTSKCLETLLALVEQRGGIADKDQLLSRIWPDTVVEEKNLTINISQLRKALGEGPSENRYIVTVPGRGYRFVATVEEIAAVAPAKDDEPSPGATVAERPAPPRRWLWVLVAAVAILAGSAVWWTIRGRDPAPTLAVMPFRVLGEQPGREYLGVGLADALVTRLSNLRKIVVLPIATSQRYADADPLAAGRSLKVRFVLEGTIRNASDRIRVSVRLRATDTGASVVAASFDERFTDILGVEDSISQQVAASLAAHLSQEERTRLVRHETRSEEAHQLFMQGRYLRGVSQTGDGLRQAADCFDGAVRKDSEYALAHAWLADTLALDALYYAEPKSALERAARAAQRAMSIDGSLADAQEATGAVALMNFQWAAAESAFRRALELNATTSYASDWLGYLFMMQGRVGDAQAELARAQRSSPVELALSVDLGMSAYFGRQYARAIEAQKTNLSRDPNFWVALIELARTYDASGQPAEAIPLFQRAIQQYACPWLTTCLARAHIHAGQTDQGRRLLKELDAQAASAYVSPVWFALIHEALGEKEAALDRLEHAWSIRAPFLIHLKADPVFDRLRGEPRFQALLEAAGLSDASRAR